MKSLNSSDICRCAKRQLKRFTWREKSYQISKTCFNVNYLPSYKLLKIKTAIFPVVLHIKSTDFVQGRGCWKVNNSLPSDKEYMYMYIQTMQTQIIDTKKPQYSVLVCNIDKIQYRGKSISFST